MGAYSLNDKARVEGTPNGVQELSPPQERAKQVAGTLSGREQQMLATGRALMTNPKIS
jgi:branched-chain amino acid transport system ATP-binding protein